jgi:hypothetical protein
MIVVKMNEKKETNNAAENVCENVIDHSWTHKASDI